MNVTAVADASPASRLASLAIDALRALRWPQIRAAMLLGLALTAWSWTVFIHPIARIAQSMPLMHMMLQSLIADQVKALCLLVAIAIADRAVDEGARRRRAYVLAALAGCVVGIALSEPFNWAFRTYVMPNAWPANYTWLHGTPALFYWPIFALTHWLLIGSAVVFLYADRRAARNTAQLLRDAELDRIRRSRLALESRLQAMQARVEPQFLLNTLAQVERLYEIDAQLAARMLDDLIAYLRAAMPLMRDTSSTVAQEIELARAYLDIVRLRLGERLSVRTQTPPEAARLRMPPMMLLPLIDHAIVRGLEPSRAQGTISIGARVFEGRLLLTIADGGAGFVPDGEGSGIAAIRERLEALYRGDAKLDLRRRGDDTTVAVLDLPLEHRESG
ncbi:MAG TPA: histidine kinase, partial [Solirubrobacteraceae bacterium]|nr:histidine kinase [Solirubrobacteraceae bacterium]